MEVKYEYFDNQDIKQANVKKNEEVAKVEKEGGSTETKAVPTPKVEAFTPESTVDPTPKVEVTPEDKPRWVILNEWTPCSRSCGNGMCIGVP